MTNSQLHSIIEAAREHSQRLAEDVRLASTRMEHIRVTARAHEAQTLLQQLESLTGEHATNEELS